ncbi:MAG: DegV family protein [Clostridia bacterium]|nr:DegV family protein [Clostridia bacterium]
MSKYILSCCSTADMPESFFNERNIPYVCFHYTLDGKEYADDLGKSVPFEEFYKRIADGSMPTTSQVNTDQYVAFFEPFLKDGYDIVHLSFSSGLSGSYNSARIARNDLVERYPERNIRIVDTLAASGGYGLLVDIAADMRDHGATVDEIADQIEEMKLNLHHWFFTTDLTHFKRGGRVSAIAAVAGTILNICPLMNVSNEGKLIPRKKIRGKKNVIKEIVDTMKAHAENGTDYNRKCFMVNSACYDDARAVADLVEEAFPKLAAPVMINSIGTVIGSHTGPGTVALFFVGDKRID